MPQISTHEFERLATAGRSYAPSVLFQVPECTIQGGFESPLRQLTHR
jgi:hypothetical protein